MIGWARRGRVGALAGLSFRALPLLGIAAFLVVLARVPGTPATIARVLVGAGYLGALIVLWLNRTHPWILVVLLGAALNAAVILANGGRMPVPVGPGTPLASLGDILAVEIGGVGVAVSPGDVAMAAGIAGFVQAAMSRAGNAP